MADLRDHLTRDHPLFDVRRFWDESTLRPSRYTHPFPLRRVDPRRASAARPVRPNG